MAVTDISLKEDTILKKEKKQSSDLRSFCKYIKPIKTSAKIMPMKSCTQHGNTSVYHHCIRVAYLSYLIANTLPVKVDNSSLIRGAFLHDYFLYDWHERRKEERLHGFTHPKTALNNAKLDFDLNRKEENIIRSHMWPLTLFHVPASKEALIVCFADKVCSSGETASGLCHKYAQKAKR